MDPDRPEGSASQGRCRECCSATKSCCREFFSSTKRHAWHVVGYNWFVAATFLPWYLLLVAGFWLLRSPAGMRAVRYPIGITCSVGFLLLEVTCFWLERSWSRVQVWNFWRFAALGVCGYALLCCLVLKNDALGCLLLFALFLGMRESLFQYFHFYRSSMPLKERITASLMGGFTFGLIVSVVLASVYLLTRLAYLNDEALAMASSELLYVLVLPVLRFLTRLILTQFISSAVVGPHPFDMQGPGTVKPWTKGVFRPQLDALVVYADFIFGLMCALEAPFAIVLLLVPKALVFALALAMNCLLDVLFISVLDTLQQRRLRPSPEMLAGAEELATEKWAPAYAIRRQPSMVAVAINGTLQTSGSTETTPLAPPTAPASEEVAQQESATAVEDDEASQGRCSRICTTVSASFFGDRSRSREPASSEAERAKEEEPMSPRVCLLLDEYDSMVVQNRENFQTSWAFRSSPTLYLYQERKITFMTHLLGALLAMFFGACTVLILRLHTFSSREFWIRLGVLAAAKILTDFASCWVFEWICHEVQPQRREILWQFRQELATFHGWFLRLLLAMCPLVPILVAIC